MMTCDYALFNFVFPGLISDLSAESLISSLDIDWFSSISFKFFSPYLKSSSFVFDYLPYLEPDRDFLLYFSVNLKVLLESLFDLCMFSMCIYWIDLSIFKLCSSFIELSFIEPSSKKQWVK